MPQQREHLIQARRNLHILDQFNFTSCACLDWLVILAFYTVLHWVDAFLATLNIHPGNHHERNLEVRARLPAISAHYIRLYAVSREARYHARTYRMRRIRYMRTLQNDFAAIRIYFGR